jgi:nicotinate-nucleotide adenylyltransferase
MRIGILGGTFDPVHLAHLVLAESCLDQAALDAVWFVPAPRPPHKPEGTAAPFPDRLAMLQLAIAGHPRFRIDTCEANRPGPSYTFQTLHDLSSASPGTEWFLILGSDSLRDLPTWRKPEEIARLATLLIAQRPGVSAPAPPADFRAQTILMPLLEISSSDIRQRIAAGRSIRYLVPGQVEEYLHRQQLYTQSDS